MRKFGKMISVGIIVCVIGGAGYGIYKIVDGVKNSNPDDKVKDKPVEDLIDEDQSKKTKEEFDTIKDKQPKSEDIVIPDNATEEEKEKLSITKQYLTIFDAVNKVYLNALKASGQDINKFVLSEISDIYITGASCVFNLDVIKEKNGKYYHSNIFIDVPSQKIETIDDLILQSQKFTHGTIQHEFDSYLSNREMNQKLFQDWTDAQKCELLLDVVMFENNIITEDPPYESKIFIFNKESDCYEVRSMEYFLHTNGRTYQEMQEYIRTHKTWANVNLLNSYKKSPFNWQSFLNEYKAYQQSQQEAQAQAEIDSISKKDEQGKVVGLDWNAKREKRDQNDVKIGGESNQETNQYANLYPMDRGL